MPFSFSVKGYTLSRFPSRLHHVTPFLLTAIRLSQTPWFPKVAFDASVSLLLSAIDVLAKSCQASLSILVIIRYCIEEFVLHIPSNRFPLFSFSRPPVRKSFSAIVFVLHFSVLVKFIRKQAENYREVISFTCKYFIRSYVLLACPSLFCVSCFLNPFISLALLTPICSAAEKAYHH